MKDFCLLKREEIGFWKNMGQRNMKHYYELKRCFFFLLKQPFRFRLSMAIESRHSIDKAGQFQDNLRRARHLAPSKADLQKTNRFFFFKKQITKEESTFWVFGRTDSSLSCAIDSVDSQSFSVFAQYFFCCFFKRKFLLFFSCNNNPFLSHHHHHHRF